jgi:hypothetical protein
MSDGKRMSSKELVPLTYWVIHQNESVVATAIPEITARFHSADDIGWYGTA